MDGIALKPLTVSFSEPGFVARLANENRGGDEKLNTMGPQNPQSLNRYSYVLNNPVRNTDPSGHWTFSINLGFIAGGGAAARGTVSVAIDGDLNVGVFIGGGGGGMTGIAGGAGPSVTFTGAPSIENLKGTSIQIGGQAGEVGGVSGEVVIMPNKGAKPYVGLSIGGKLMLNAPFPGEGHITTETAVGFTLKDAADGFTNLYNGMQGNVNEGLKRLDSYTHPNLP